MWRLMTAAQEQAWLNGYWQPFDTRDSYAGTEWFDTLGDIFPD